MSKKRRHIPKKVREAVYAKYDGHCAYCGKPIAYKDMHVDHFKPLSFNRGTDDLENLMPACRRCNYYKDNFMLEGFRKRLAGIPKRLREHSAHKMIYNLALDYGMVIENKPDIKFYFEKQMEKQAVVKTDEKPNEIIKEAMVKIIKEEKKNAK